jgi:hypothetical protein
LSRRRFNLLNRGRNFWESKETLEFSKTDNYFVGENERKEE